MVLIRAAKALNKFNPLKINEYGESIGDEDEQIGVNVIVKRAGRLRQIVANAGKEGAVIVERFAPKKSNIGYNVVTEKFEDLIAGVIDPAKVTRSAAKCCIDCRSDADN